MYLTAGRKLIIIISKIELKHNNPCGEKEL